MVAFKVAANICYTVMPLLEKCTLLKPLTREKFDGIEWKVATCIERPPLHEGQFLNYCYTLMQMH